jgi:spore germination protein YaaH
MAGEEERWDAGARLTDVGLFHFRLGDRGELAGKLDERTLELARSRGARTHLVIASSGQKSLLHFLLNPNYRARNSFVGEIAALARRHRVDGLQLDFESVLAEDRWHFISFLEELRALLPDGMLFSLALPARDEETPENALRYRGLAELADRFLIMVYDEHWQGGRPGSIASKGWHDRVVAHVLRELPAEKVIIGLPFYGRIWQRETVARATRYPELAGIVAEKRAEVRHDLDGTHHFTFTETVTAECWFEDAATLHAKFSAARALGARSVGFWRLGQEDPRVWGLVRREGDGRDAAAPRDRGRAR